MNWTIEKIYKKLQEYAKAETDTEKSLVLCFALQIIREDREEGKVFNKIYEILHVVNEQNTIQAIYGMKEAVRELPKLTRHWGAEVEDSPYADDAK